MVTIDVAMLAISFAGLNLTLVMIVIMIICLKRRK